MGPEVNTAAATVSASLSYEAPRQEQVKTRESTSVSQRPSRACATAASSKSNTCGRRGSEGKGYTGNSRAHRGKSRTAPPRQASSDRRHSTPVAAAASSSSSRQSSRHAVEDELSTASAATSQQQQQQQSVRRTRPSSSDLPSCDSSPIMGSTISRARSKRETSSDNNLNRRKSSSAPPPSPPAPIPSLAVPAATPPAAAIVASALASDSMNAARRRAGEPDPNPRECRRAGPVRAVPASRRSCPPRAAAPTPLSTATTPSRAISDSKGCEKKGSTRVSRSDSKSNSGAKPTGVPLPALVGAGAGIGAWHSSRPTRAAAVVAAARLRQDHDNCSPSSSVASCKSTGEREREDDSWKARRKRRMSTGSVKAGDNTATATAAAAEHSGRAGARRGEGGVVAEREEAASAIGSASEQCRRLVSLEDVWNALGAEYFQDPHVVQDVLSSLMVENGGKPLRTSANTDPWRSPSGRAGPARTGSERGQAEKDEGAVAVSVCGWESMNSCSAGGRRVAGVGKAGTRYCWKAVRRYSSEGGSGSSQGNGCHLVGVERVESGNGVYRGERVTALTNMVPLTTYLERGDGRANSLGAAAAAAPSAAAASDTTITACTSTERSCSSGVGDGSSRRDSVVAISAIEADHADLELSMNNSKPSMKSPVATIRVPTSRRACRDSTAAARVPLPPSRSGSAVCAAAAAPAGVGGGDNIASVPYVSGSQLERTRRASRRSSTKTAAREGEAGGKIQAAARAASGHRTSETAREMNAVQPAGPGPGSGSESGSAAKRRSRENGFAGTVGGGSAAAVAERLSAEREDGVGLMPEAETSGGEVVVRRGNEETSGIDRRHSEAADEGRGGRVQVGAERNMLGLKSTSDAERSGRQAGAGGRYGDTGPVAAAGAAAGTVRLPIGSNCVEDVAGPQPSQVGGANGVRQLSAAERLAACSLQRPKGKDETDEVSFRLATLKEALGLLEEVAIVPALGRVADAVQVSVDRSAEDRAKNIAAIRIERAWRAVCHVRSPAPRGGIRRRARAASFSSLSSSYAAVDVSAHASRKRASGVFSSPSTGSGKHGVVRKAATAAPAAASGDHSLSTRRRRREGGGEKRESWSPSGSGGDGHGGRNGDGGGGSAMTSRNKKQRLLEQHRKQQHHDRRRSTGSILWSSSAAPLPSAGASCDGARGSAVSAEADVVSSPPRSRGRRKSYGGVTCTPPSPPKAERSDARCHNRKRSASCAAAALVPAAAVAMSTGDGATGSTPPKRSRRSGRLQPTAPNQPGGGGSVGFHNKQAEAVRTGVSLLSRGPPLKGFSKGVLVVEKSGGGAGAESDSSASNDAGSPARGGGNGNGNGVNIGRRLSTGSNSSRAHHRFHGDRERGRADDGKRHCCREFDCARRAHFGTPGWVPVHCVEHRRDWEVFLKYASCLAEGCEDRPAFGFPGDHSRVYCRRHRIAGAVTLASAGWKMPDGPRYAGAGGWVEAEEDGMGVPVDSDAEEDVEEMAAAEAAVKADSARKAAELAAQTAALGDSEAPAPVSAPVKDRRASVDRVKQEGAAPGTEKPVVQEAKTKAPKHQAGVGREDVLVSNNRGKRNGGGALRGVCEVRPKKIGGPRGAKPKKSKKARDGGKRRHNKEEGEDDDDDDDDDDAVISVKSDSEVLNSDGVLDLDAAVSGKLGFGDLEPSSSSTSSSSSSLLSSSSDSDSDSDSDSSSSSTSSTSSSSSDDESLSLSSSLLSSSSSSSSDSDSSSSPSSSSSSDSDSSSSSSSSSPSSSDDDGDDDTTSLTAQRKEQGRKDNKEESANDPNYAPGRFAFLVPSKKCDRPILVGKILPPTPASAALAEGDAPAQPPRPPRLSPPEAVPPPTIPVSSATALLLAQVAALSGHPAASAAGAGATGVAAAFAGTGGVDGVVSGGGVKGGGGPAGARGGADVKGGEVEEAEEQKRVREDAKKWIYVHWHTPASLRRGDYCRGPFTPDFVKREGTKSGGWAPFVTKIRKSSVVVTCASLLASRCIPAECLKELGV